MKRLGYIIHTLFEKCRGAFAITLFALLPPLVAEAKPSAILSDEVNASDEFTTANETKTNDCAPRLIELLPFEDSVYEPFDPRELVTELRLQLVNDAPVGCTARLAIESVSGPIRRLSNGGESLIYRFVDETGAVVPSRIDGSSSIVFNVPPIKGAPFEVSVNTLVLEGQVAPPNTYTDEINIRLFGSASTTPLEVLNRQISITVNPRVELNIAGARSNFAASGLTVDTVNFGELETGESQSVYVQVRANSNAQISLESEHGGVLRHIIQPAQAKTEVAYSAELDRQILDFKSGPVILQRQVGRSLVGENYE